MVGDASVWVSYFVDTDAHHAATRPWIRRAISRGILFVEPSIVLPEISGPVRRRLNAKRATDAIAFLQRLPKFLILGVDEGLAMRAAEIAGEFRLRGADAVYVALAEALSLPLYTWDKEIIDRTKTIITAQTP